VGIIILAIVSALMGLSSSTVTQSESAQSQAAADSVFSMPRKHQELARLRQLIAVMMRESNYQLAETYSHDAIKLISDDPISHYNLACAEARLGRQQQAIDSLNRAMEYGFRGAEHMAADEDLKDLRDHESWSELLELAGRPPLPGKNVEVRPGVIQDNVGLVAEENTVYDPKTGLLRSFLRYESPEAIARQKELPIVSYGGKVAERLRQWQQEGSAAGLTNVLYENHDKDHSNLEYKRYPQLSRIEYIDAATAEGLTTGLQHQLLFNGAVIGNSSTAMTSGVFWRSQPRLAYCDKLLISRITRQHFSNHLYFYPEHRDYDPGHNGRDGGYGDVYPANTPYVLISQGSSGSDREFMDAIAATLAAMRPEVQEKLMASGVLMSVVQMIFRRCNSPVVTDEDYLSGKAHPVVFSGDQLQPLKMVEMAHELTVDRLPPVALVAVTDEDQPVVGRDYFAAAAREELFTTGAAVARVARSVQKTRRMTLSAQQGRDLNGKALTYHWKVLQGDPELIRIEPQNEEQSVVRVSIDHHQRFDVSSAEKMQSNRVDIGLFVHNGDYYSAPAFLSIYYPDNEARVYDDDGRIQSVTYSDPGNGGNYVDPMVVTPFAWRDEYRYQGDTMIGWTRHRGKSAQNFTADGSLVLTTDSLGRPMTARTVTYVGQARSKKLPPILEQRAGGEILHYGYRSKTDMVGEITGRVPATE
jgi:hypothetical protein